MSENNKILFQIAALDLKQYDRLNNNLTIRQVIAHNYFVTPAEIQALADVHGYASAGRIRIVSHARQRMHERGARFEDLRQALISATCCGPANDGKLCFR